MLAAVPIYLSIHPDTLSIRYLLSHLPFCQSIQTHYLYVICFPIYLSVNPSRHIIHNYVSCCPHLPVNPSRHIIRMLVAVPIYLSSNPFISVLVGLFQPLCSVGKGCPHCCCACFQWRAGGDGICSEWSLRATTKKKGEKMGGLKKGWFSDYNELYMEAEGWLSTCRWSRIGVEGRQITCRHVKQHLFKNVNPFPPLLVLCLLVWSARILKHAYLLLSIFFTSPSFY